MFIYSLFVNQLNLNVKIIKKNSNVKFAKINFLIELMYYFKHLSKRH
jgi:hypothetical protein